MTILTFDLILTWRLTFCYLGNFNIPLKSTRLEIQNAASLRPLVRELGTGAGGGGQFLSPSQQGAFGQMPQRGEG